MNSKHMLFHIVTGVLLAMFIISSAVTIALNLKFIYYADIERYDLTTRSGLTAEELKQDYAELIDYNSPWGDDKLEFPHFTMSEGGRQHFAEARDIFLFFAWGILMFGIPAILGMFFAHQKRYGTSYLGIAAFITLVLPALLGLFALTAWDKLFVLFHEVSFGNDLWIFDPDTDPVINVLPDEFFLHEAFAIFGIVILGGIICLISYIRTRHNSEKA